MRHDPAGVDLRYQPVIGDYFDAMASAARHSRFAAAMGAALVVMASTAIVLIGDKVSVVILLAGILFLTGHLPAALSLGTVWRKRSLLTREVVIHADATGVRSSLAGTKSEVDWSTFKRVRDVRTAFLLDLGTGGGAIVPKRVFDADSLARFRALARGAGVLDASSPALDLGVGSLIGVVVGGLFMLSIVVVNKP